MAVVWFLVYLSFVLAMVWFFTYLSLVSVGVSNLVEILPPKVGSVEFCIAAHL
jgi:hypothetical protein